MKLEEKGNSNPSSVEIEEMTTWTWQILLVICVESSVGLLVLYTWIWALSGPLSKSTSKLFVAILCNLVYWIVGVVLTVLIQ